MVEIWYFPVPNSLLIDVPVLCKGVELRIKKLYIFKNFYKTSKMSKPFQSRTKVSTAKAYYFNHFFSFVNAPTTFNDQDLHLNLKVTHIISHISMTKYLFCFLYSRHNSNKNKKRNLELIKLVSIVIWE